MHVGKGKIYFDRTDPAYPLCPHHREDVITCERIEGCQGKCVAVILLEVGSAVERREALEDKLMDLMGRYELSSEEVERLYEVEEGLAEINKLRGEVQDENFRRTSTEGI